MDVFVARQAIFDRNLRVYAYELLFRSCQTNSFDGSEASLATSRVISTTLFSLGVDRVLRGKKAFVNFPRELLLDQRALALPPDLAVPEILETVEDDAEVIAACLNLKRHGYLLALDDFCLNKRNGALAEIADVIKVDFRLAEGDVRRRIADFYGRRGRRMLAEKVETQEEFEYARTHGYSYFQGYFFCRPLIIAGGEVPGFKLNYLRVLQHIHSRELEFDRLERVLKREVSLSYKLLRYINSSVFGFSSHVSSIRQALALLGEIELRKWACLAVVPALASDKPDELLTTAVVRARFCEMIARPAGAGSRRSELFLMGLFSLLDAMMGRPLAEVLAGLDLAPDVSTALLGSAPVSDRPASVFALMRACESGEWEALQDAAARLNVEPGTVAETYLSSLAWADQALQLAIAP